MAKVIFNADDLGWSEGINRGILEAYQKGVVNSSTIMVTGRAFEQAVEMVQKEQLTNIGLHFNLTEGKSVLNTHIHLTNENAEFYRNIHQRDMIDLNEVYLELKAQFDKAINAGLEITHLDSHHHIHMTRKLRKVFADFSYEVNLPLRKMKPTSRNPIKRFLFWKDMRKATYFTPYFSADFYGEKATEENLLKLLKKHQGKEVEIMCHPAYADEYNGNYNQGREEELRILTSSKIKNLVLNLNKK